jgi:hypothetical protein
MLVTNEAISCGNAGSIPPATVLPLTVVARPRGTFGAETVTVDVCSW